MKKLLFILLSVLLIATGCSSKPADNASTENAAPVKYTHVYDNDIEQLDYLVTNKNTNNRITTNFVEGLYANDTKGNTVPAIAESHSVSEDGLTYTFNIRKGVKWVTATGEEYAEVTAHDFVAGLKHVADSKAETVDVVRPFIKNLAEYVDGSVAFEEVGVKAVDDYTLTYTLTQPTPFFLSLTLYTVLYPVNEKFLTSKGSEFGTTLADSILYNSAYILTTNDSKSKIAMKKNEAYWDKDNVFVDVVELIYDDGSDVYSVIKGFENGTYVSAGLSPAWEDFATYIEKYKGNYNATLPNVYTFGPFFNFNRQAFEYTNKDDAAKKVAQDAILNKNFRAAFKAAFDRVAYNRQSMPEEIALLSVRNIYTYPEIVKTSAGVTYGTLVGNELNKLNSTSLDYSDGVDIALNKEAALKYIEAAKAEGITFPVTLDVLTVSTSPILLKRTASLKESIESNTDGQILIEIHQVDRDTYSNIGYYSEDPAAKDYDLSLTAGWGPDYQDPKTFLDTFSPKDGAYLTNIGLEPLGKNPASDAALNKLGLVEYQALLDKASTEYSDLDKRYQLMAEAEAYLLNNVIYIPMSQNTRGYVVSKVVPFSSANGLTVDSGYRFKYKKLQDTIVSQEQFEAAYAEWKSASKN